jgi:hypothetical protein
MESTGVVVDGTLMLLHGDSFPLFLASALQMSTKRSNNENF